MNDIAMLMFAALCTYILFGLVIASQEFPKNVEFELECLDHAKGCKIHEIYYSNLTKIEKYREVQSLYKIVEKLKKEIYKDDLERPGIFTMGW